MDCLIPDVWSEICVFLDVFSLLNFELSHKSRCNTELAWQRVLQTRFQLSLTNRQYLMANPRRSVQQLMNSTDMQLFRMDTTDLLGKSNAWCEEVKRLLVERGGAPFPGATALLNMTPPFGPGDKIDACEERLVEQWFRIRELAQRGIVRYQATLAELSVGDKIMHYFGKNFGQSPSGMSKIGQCGGVLKSAVSRVDAVCNGVVQFRERARTDEFGVSHFDGAIGWASRCDMLVMLLFRN